jgi:NitT/TauT family transport system ATP-binding protein
VEMMILKNISKKFDDYLIFDNLNLEISNNKITAIMGNSGVGKTTLLNIIAGVTSFTGEIENNTKLISAVFSEQRLLNNLTVFENLNYVLEHVIKNKAERYKLITNKLKALEIFDKKDAYPKELSTGIAQRVAIARAFLYPADTIIMDEAFRGLDIGIKAKLIELFYRLWVEKKQTVIIVTHDVNEALLLADEIIVLSGSPAKVNYKKQIDINQLDRISTNQTIKDTYADIMDCFISK